MIEITDPELIWISTPKNTWYNQILWKCHALRIIVRELEYPKTHTGLRRPLTTLHNSYIYLTQEEYVMFKISFVGQIDRKELFKGVIYYRG